MATLMSLPTELFERIAESADSQDLFALRLLSRTAASMVTRTYTNTHFSCRTLLLNKAQLHRAIDVASHEVFGPAVETLRIDISEIQLEYITSLPAARKRELSAVYFEESAFHADHMSTYMLNAVLCKLRGHGERCRLKEIELFDGHDTSPGHGTNIPEGRVAPFMDDISAFGRVMEAIHMSGASIEFLNINKTSEWTLPLHYLTTDGMYNCSTLSVFRQLRTLSLNIWYDINAGQDVASIFHTCKTLENLRLSWNRSITRRGFAQEVREVDDQGYLMSDILDSLPPNLKVLAIESTSVVYAEVIDALRAASRLETLELSNVIVLDREKETKITYATEASQDEDPLEASLQRESGKSVQCFDCWEEETED